MRSEATVGAALVAPIFLLLAALLLVPELHALALTVFDEGRFVGLKHYRVVLGGGGPVGALVNTLVFTTASVAGSVTLGFAFALLLDRRTRARRLVRSLALAPFVIPPIVGAFSWKMMLDPNFGILNYGLTLVGIPMGRVEWLSDPRLAMASVIIAEVWGDTPYVTLILLAGLQSLPRSPFEAAAMDGAGTWMVFRRVLVPLLAPALLVAAIFRTVFAVREFARIWVMTQGGPVNATNVLSMEVYRNLFMYGREGQSAVIGLIMLLIAFGLTLPLMARLYRVTVRSS
jgi:multiple sugar transport system permease protein